MTTDFRALCADLLRELDHASAWDYQQALKDQARAALAQPELEGPSDEELDLVVIAIQALIPPQPDATTHHLSAVDRGREILRQRLARWGRPTPPVVMPVLSKDTQVIEPPETTLLVPYFSRPVPVSERLPGPEDCQFNPGATVGSCWCWTPPTYASGPGYWSFEPLEWAEDATHWLPAHALPVPADD